MKFYSVEPRYDNVYEFWRCVGTGRVHGIFQGNYMCDVTEEN
jgi:hypothetical protein